MGPRSAWLPEDTPKPVLLINSVSRGSPLIAAVDLAASVAPNSILNRGLW